MSQESTTVYAQGGKGNNRLIAWEGEKTMTFTVTDALISPMGLAVLSGAGLFDASEQVVHAHVAITATADSTSGVVTIPYADLADEAGITDGNAILVCDGSTGTGAAYVTVVDSTGYGYAWPSKPFAISSAAGTAAKGGAISIASTDSVVFTPSTSVTADKTLVAGKTVKVDFYVVLKSGASEIVIEPDSFGGYFYVEADTLFRREDNGQDMAATLTFPRVKVQSGFTFTMAATGDPSTFDFTMDAFPGVTQFDSTKKVCVVMDIVGNDSQGTTTTVTHPTHKDAATA